MFKSAKFSLSDGRLEEFAGIYGLIFNNQTFIILFCGIATYVGRHSSTVTETIAWGKQPLHSEVGDLTLVCNGEIYNHERLRRELQDRHHFRTHSDSEVILHLYEDLGPASVTKLDGMFAFVLSDGKQVFAARDPLGIKPLYTGRDADDGLWFASELKALINVSSSIEEVPPGTAYAGGTVWPSC